jgi:hypothetical protein
MYWSWKQGHDLQATKFMYRSPVNHEASHDLEQGRPQRRKNEDGYI